MINHKGSMNPMYGKRHSEITKQKISDTQKQRFERYRNAQHISMDEFLKSESLNRRIIEVVHALLEQKKDTYGM